jgi:hypothetical protein
LLFEVAQSTDHLGQLLNGDPLSLSLLVWRGGDAENGFLITHVPHDTGLGAYRGLLTKLKMAGYP